MSDRILAVAAHPDDEVLGCGATLARHAARGDEVNILLVADGESSRDIAGGANESDDRVAKRRIAAHRAAATLGARQPRFLDFPDQRLDTVSLLDLTRRIEDVIVEINPNVIYTHHAGDLNEDHRRVAQALLTACRPLPGRRALRILAFEVLSSTEWGAGLSGSPFEPTLFVDAAGFLKTKMKALEAYEREMRPFPHARSHRAVLALARMRGAAVGVAAAEAFRLIREVQTP